MAKHKKFKLGELVYIKGIGYPFNIQDAKNDTWEGVSAIVVGLNAGARKNMVDVETLIPMRTDTGDMKGTLVFPEHLFRENRPWLRAKIKYILRLKNKLEKTAGEITEIIEKIS